MNRLKIMFGLGIWVAILPYLGFPYFFKNILFSITGLGIIFLNYYLYKELKIETKEENFDNFSENSDFDKEEKNPQEKYTTFN